MTEGRLARQLEAADFAAPHPVYCVWELTLACDLGCRHCGSRAGKARPDELTTEQCLDVVDELADLGVREVTLIGGEAYLRRDWDRIAAAIRDRNMRCSITTGARNLSPDRVQKAVDAGVDGISISIDGLEQTHDAQRGVKGSWRAAVDAARRVAKTSMRLGFNSQINQLSLPELPAMADLLVDVGAGAWQLQLTVPMGRAADRPGLLLQPWHLLELFPLLVWIKQTKLDPSDIRLYPGNNIGYFSPYEALLRHRGDEGAHWGSCGAGKWALGLEADGKIKGCPSLPSETYTGGMLGRDRLADVVANSPELREIRERTVDDLWGWCRSCYYADVCKAGCSWMANMLFERTGNNPYCIHRALEHEKQGLRERVVRVAAAPGVPFDGGRFEIVVEPMETPVTPNILGLEPATVTTLASDAGSAWDAETIRERLQRQ